MKDCSATVDGIGSLHGPSCSKDNGIKDVKMEEEQPGFTDREPYTQKIQDIELITDSAVLLEENENEQEPCIKSNGTEDVKMNKEKPGFTDRDPCTQEMQDNELITDNAVHLEDNDNDQERLTKNNGTEDVKMKEEQPGFTDREPCIQEMQDIEQITDSAVSLEDNDNDQELFRFSLETFLKEEGTQRFTSPTLHNPSGSQEDRDLVQSLQIRQARILNLTQKRDRLFNLVGLKTNRL